MKKKTWAATVKFQPSRHSSNLVMNRFIAPPPPFNDKWVKHAPELIYLSKWLTWPRPHVTCGWVSLKRKWGGRILTVPRSAPGGKMWRREDAAPDETKWKCAHIVRWFDLRIQLLSKHREGQHVLTKTLCPPFTTYSRPLHAFRWVTAYLLSSWTVKKNIYIWWIISGRVKFNSTFFKGLVYKMTSLISLKLSLFSLSCLLLCCWRGL